MHRHSCWPPLASSIHSRPVSETKESWRPHTRGSCIQRDRRCEYIPSRGLSYTLDARPENLFQICQRIPFVLNPGTKAIFRLFRTKTINPDNHGIFFRWGRSRHSSVHPGVRAGRSGTKGCQSRKEGVLIAKAFWSLPHSRAHISPSNVQCEFFGQLFVLTCPETEQCPHTFFTSSQMALRTDILYSMLPER